MSSPPHETPPRSRGQKRLLVVAGLVTVVVAAAVFYRSRNREPAFDELLKQAQAALAAGDIRQALRLSDELLERSPESAEAMLVGGQTRLRMGRCREAERMLRRVLKQDASNVEAHRNLMFLLKMEARFWEMRPHALALLRAGDSGSEFLIPLAAPDELALSQREFKQAEACRSSVPDDASPMLGVARHLIQNAQTARAIALLRTIVADMPENIAAQALLGTAIQQTGDDGAFLAWRRQLPAVADAHPEIWYLRGARARRRDRPRVAARCFWEAIRRDPNHRRAHFQLAQLLRAEDKPKQAQPFAERFRLLEEVSRVVTRGDDNSGSKLTAKTMHRIATLMEQLGRLWEAAGWYRKALELDPRFPEADRRLKAVTAQLDATTPLTLPSANPAGRIDLSGYPLPAQGAGGGDPIRKSAPENSAIAFSDVAKSLGLVFRFQNGANPRAGIARMYEFSGGGVAVLDYEGDGWPDLYFTQGSAWPLGTGGHRDRLFRNVGGERFEDVTVSAGLGDERYSQGAAVGDYNNDGFPDIYLANIGGNRLYQNNGDGTFTDVGASLQVEGDEWTLSGLLADVNGDGHPDIYCVNYLAGDDVFTRKCVNPRGPIQCPLHYFPSAQDRLYLNKGDGRFEDVTKSSGILLPEGKGMGIVGANFERNGRLSLFIANDDKPNFFFVDKEKRPGALVSYENRGVISGLAFGENGTAQSCMGVAAGDVNNDGLLDLFVTNFVNEPGNLYVQRRGGVFEDVARRAGLHQPTFSLMGWGTQFLDADLDGALDLVVANGHLDHNTAGNLPYRMRTQVFRNLGDLRFRELSSARLGSYFERSYAGRTVARIDWNRDGADDACVTHVDAPAALLSNSTRRRGRFLTIRLRGVTGSRDAVGAIVRIKAGNHTWYRHLTAGDGFQASNERKLCFGLGSRSRVDEATVFWPSGLVQQLSPPPAADSEIMVIEGRPPLRLNSRR